MRTRECLNGEWNFLPLYNGAVPGDRLEEVSWEDKIRVPSSWRYLLRNMPDSLQTYQPYNLFGYPERWNKAEAGILGTTVPIARRKGQRIRLVFNGILQRARIYINNRLELETEEAFLPVRLD